MLRLAPEIHRHILAMHGVSRRPPITERSGFSRTILAARILQARLGRAPGIRNSPDGI
jgi:hypothetical protein